MTKKRETLMVISLSIRMTFESKGEAENFYWDALKYGAECCLVGTQCSASYEYPEADAQMAKVADSLEAFARQKASVRGRTLQGVRDVKSFAGRTIEVYRG